MNANEITIVPSDLTATLLLVTGIILLLLEIKIVSQGIMGFIGGIFLVAAAVIIYQDGTPFWGVPIAWILPVIGLILVLFGALSMLAVKAHQEKVVTGYLGYVGEIAEASESLEPEGRVFFQGTYWDAISKVPIAKGEKVRIVAADRLKLVVEPLRVEV